jgi:hypothetical protein
MALGSVLFDDMFSPAPENLQSSQHLASQTRKEELRRHQALIALLIGREWEDI